MRGRDKGLEIFQGAIIRVNPDVIGHIVAIIGQGGRVVGQNPDALHPQRFNVIEAAHRPAKIAVTIVVAVLQRP